MPVNKVSYRQRGELVTSMNIISCTHLVERGWHLGEGGREKWDIEFVDHNGYFRRIRYPDQKLAFMITDFLVAEETDDETYGVGQ